MNASFIVWAVFMVLLVTIMVLFARRRKQIDQAVEDAAASVLPRIGEIAERKHHARYGQNGSKPQSESRYCAFSSILG